MVSKGIWDKHLPLNEFAYYNISIQQLKWHLLKLCTVEKVVLQFDGLKWVKASY